MRLALDGSASVIMLGSFGQPASRGLGAISQRGPPRVLRGRPGRERAVVGYEQAELEAYPCPSAAEPYRVEYRGGLLSESCARTTLGGHLHATLKVVAIPPPSFPCLLNLFPIHLLLRGGLIPTLTFSASPRPGRTTRPVQNIQRWFTFGS